MFWSKFQHHLMFFFFSFVLLMQGLIFVATQAVPYHNYELKSEWLSPKNGQTLVNGQVLELQAQLESKNKKISAVYFVVSDPDNNLAVNFETQNSKDNIYGSLLTWDTTDWPTGVYNIRARANIIDEQGRVTETQESMPTWVKIISIDEYNAWLANNAPADISVSTLANPNASGTDTDQAAQDALSLEANKNIVVDLDNSDNTTSTATSTPTDNATSTQVSVPDLELDSPENNTTISSRSFLVNFSTNFLSDNVQLEFINTDNAAISTRSIVIEKTDGYSWVKNIDLDDTFIDGPYKLIISASIPGGNLTVNKSFDYILDAPSSIKPEDLFMDVINLSSNLQGPVGLRAEANLRIDNLDFVIEDSVNHVEALRIVGHNTATENNEGAVFTAMWDTAVLANGNYLVFVESKIDQQKVGSVKQLVSIYNSKNGEQSTSTLEGFREEEPSGPSVVTTPTTTVSVADNLVPSTEDGIDCERSGITDSALCQKYQAEINDSLPEICQEKNIFSSADCEQYIFTNENNLCDIEKIEDATKCREYLYKKYSPQLSCQISATSTCPQLISDQYIARLAYQLEQKNKFLAVLDNLNIETLTLNSLHDSLLAAELASDNTSLVASDKKIAILKIKNQNHLDVSENLYVSSPLAIMGDNDSDGLPDDLENYYGTDIYRADSDGDGHPDGQEVLNNYSPLGDGKLDRERTALDQILLSKLAIEEPRSSLLSADGKWLVSKAQSTDHGMNFVGQAPANTWVNLFIYSEIPFLATIKTDASGHWSYSLPDPLTEGVHQIYAAINDKSGKLLAQSAPLTFLVANVKDELPPVGLGQQINVTGSEIASKNWTMYYIIGGILLVLILLAVTLFLFRRHRRKLDNLLPESSEVASMPVSSIPTKIVTQTEDVSIQSPEEAVLPVTTEPAPTIVENKE